MRLSSWLQLFHARLRLSGLIRPRPRSRPRRQYSNVGFCVAAETLEFRQLLDGMAPLVDMSAASATLLASQTADQSTLAQQEANALSAEPISDTAAWNVLDA